MVVVVNMFLISGLAASSGMRRTRAKATAPRRPPYDITNWSTAPSRWRRKRLARAESTITPKNTKQHHSTFRTVRKRMHNGAPTFQKLTNSSVHSAEEDRSPNEPPVPNMLFMNRAHTKKHKNNRFRWTAQHFHGIFNRRMWLLRDIGLHVVLHCDSTESNSEKNSW